MGDSEVHWQFPSTFVNKLSGKKSLTQLLVKIYAFGLWICIHDLDKSVHDLYLNMLLLMPSRFLKKTSPHFVTRCIVVAAAKM